MLTVDEIKDVEQIAVFWTVGKYGTYYLVPASMLPLIYKRSWSTTKGGYAHAKYRGKAVYLHEVVFHGGYEAFFSIPEEIRRERWPDFQEKLDAKERRAA